ncbi:hypothetical protein BD410DRAFT_840831 [Rickenella mellea]|uniref:Uncharacterized protein n=1 Tax=Rickenella mellea TaxID=50990 RepID=A0A4Y7Q1C3_9AGAM|nr:hypothetical protein BD410DRAFT_840831 [Rickenella mellea]
MSTTAILPPKIPIPIPTLTQFVERNLTALFGAATADEFNEAFDTFISRTANITVNGVHVARGEFMAQIQSDRFAREDSDVKFFGAVEVADASVPAVQNPGVVGVFYEATIFETLRVLGGPATRIVTASFNAIVEQTKESSGVLVPKQVVAINQVVSVKPGEIVLPSVNNPPV